ncbi:MAG: hypothetical protein ACLQVD_07405 [Capsulimonadaceae bacterium]
MAGPALDPTPEYDLKALAALGIAVASPAAAGKAPWHTPHRLRFALALTCAATLLFFLAVEAVTAQMHYAMKTIGHDSAPSIVMAEKIKAGLADMDADVANELIAPPGQYQDALNAYDADRKQVTDNLVSAAENITYGDAERVPIRNIEEGLGVFEADVAQSRVFHKRGGDPEVLPSYHQATLEMHKVLLPAADALDKANDDMLTKVYADQKAVCGTIVGFFWTAGVLLLAALAALQIFLVRRMRRLVNPLLALATLLAIGFIVFSAASFQEESIHLKVAKEDCFDSIYALWHARAIAYDANAAESRWLLDPSYGSSSAAEFFANIAKLASFGPSESLNSLADQAAQVHVNANAWANQVPADFKGFLADEMRNITFSGEKEDAINTMRALGTYVAIDTQIRQLENSGKHDDAIALCCGTLPGQSDWAFSQFDTALGSLIDVNQQQFDLAVSRGDSQLLPFAWLTPVACIAIAGLALLGVLPRIREYEV